MMYWADSDKGGSINRAQMDGKNPQKMEFEISGKIPNISQPAGKNFIHADLVSNEITFQAY